MKVINVNNENTRMMCEIYSKSTKNTPQRRPYRQLPAQG